uniref:Uncharacterized protein n=1 Tax=Arundo donax TaxID=35708 RepID=A0A0A9GNE5_ARUDO
MRNWHGQSRNECSSSPRLDATLPATSTIRPCIVSAYVLTVSLTWGGASRRAQKASMSAGAAASRSPKAS